MLEVALALGIIVRRTPRASRADSIRASSRFARAAVSLPLRNSASNVASRLRPPSAPPRALPANFAIAAAGSSEATSDSIVRSAVRCPIPFTSISTRNHDTASVGFAITRRCASTSLICAVSINLNPPRLMNGMSRRWQLEFEIERVKARSEQHRDFGELDALLAQLQDALRDESRLHVLVLRAHQHGPKPALALGEQRLGVFFAGARNHIVRYIQDALHRAVILLELHDFAPGKNRREVHDVAEIGAAKRIDRLRIVAHRHHVAMSSSRAAAPGRPGSGWCPGTRRS